MGWRIELKHANTIAYLIAPEPRKSPRITVWQLREFLGALEGEYRDRPPLFSSDSRWIAEVVQAARSARRTLESRRLEDDSFVDAEALAFFLFDLRTLLSQYDLFALAVGTSGDRGPLNAFAEHVAYSSRHHALILIPDLPVSDEAVGMLDPLPAARQIIDHPECWPGMLFWTRGGASAFVSLEDAYRLYHLLLEALDSGPDHIGSLLQSFGREVADTRRTRILQLSDLHFGTRAALENQAYLSAHLRGAMKAVHRVVVTGDLFDNPRREDALAFRNFRADLEATTGQEIIVIPGNHDERIRGNAFRGLGQRFDQIANLEWSSLAIDDSLECVFYCFDSSRDAPDFARGRVTREQMMEVATAFESKAASRPILREYLSIALVHHHPYSFGTQAETLIQRSLAAVGLDDERFLRMDDADAFLSWCVGRRIPLVLHGHKHVARHVTQQVEWRSGTTSSWREVTAVGCGTSLGAEGFPLSYNVLEWAPSSQKWTVRFLADPGAGSGFEEQYVAIHSVTSH